MSTNMALNKINIRSILCWLGLLSISYIPKCVASDCYQPFEDSFDYTGLIFGSVFSLVKCPYTPIENYVNIYCIKNHDEPYQEVKLTDDSLTIANSIDLSVELYILVHGYTAGVDPNGNGWQTVTGRQIAKAKQCSVCLISYKNLSQCDYLTVASKIVPQVGGYVYSFIKYLITLGFDIDRCILIGHSLGAHVIGVAGYLLGGKISGPKMAIGLDPAKPYFYEPVVVRESKRLEKSDAKFVMLLHTESLIFGAPNRVGDVDYISNPGRAQSGCHNPVCSHSKATLINFAACDENNVFIGVDCETTNSGKTGRFGIFTDNAEGVYCFDIEECYPYYKTVAI